MRFLAAILVLVCLTAAGCIEKRKPVSPGSAPQPAPAPAKKEPAAPSSSPADYARNLSSAPNRAAAVIDIASINRAIVNFQAMEGRYPKSLEELVLTRYLPQIPKAPIGKRLSYDPATGQVTLVAE